MDSLFCKNCQNNIPKTAWSLHDATCARHNWHCEKCLKSFPTRDREEHEQFHTIISCECGEQIEKINMKSHKTECVCRPVQCEFCFIPVSFNEINTHMTVCDAVGNMCDKCDVWNKLCDCDMFCENCHSNVPKKQWDLHDATCEYHRWHCKKCDQTMHKSERAIHEQTIHALVSCECGEQIEEFDMTDHLRDCEYGMVPCRYCECPLQRRYINEHETVCGVRTDLCEHCGTRIKLQDFETHVCDAVQNDSPEPEPELTPPPLQEDTELIICPYCMAPARDYTLLQEHVFDEHPEVVE